MVLAYDLHVATVVIKPVYAHVFILTIQLASPTEVDSVRILGAFSDLSFVFADIF